MTILPTPMTKLSKLIHISDIHCRLLNRHEEYQSVFETLYAMLRARDLSETAVVITGDFVHSKIQLSSELVQLLSTFLRTLADIVPVICTIGNHDLLTKNSTRLDCLSPIVEMLNHPNLHFLRESGVYQFANVHFSVYSVVGSEEDWVRADEVEGDIKIALFHGPINGCVTDTGYVIQDAYDIDMFDGFDFVVTGDIHSPIQVHEYAPLIRYGGALIAQNHGESATGHGYVEWDLDAKSATFHEVPNRYGFYTLRIENGLIPDYTDMPEHVYLRIFADGIGEADLLKLVTLIRTQRTVLECTIHNKADLSTGIISSENVPVGELIHAETQNVLLDKYMREHELSTDDIAIEAIKVLNTELNGQLKPEMLPRNLRWRPLVLEFDNLFSYGAGNRINFEEMHGLYGLFAQNAAGKSSIFASLCYALFDQAPNTDKVKQIINTRATQMTCKLSLEIDGQQYVIERDAQRKKDNSVKAGVSFYQVEEDGTQHSLNGLERRDTDKIIQSYIGTYEDFSFTSLSVQNQNSPFIETSQSTRKDLLSRFMGLAIFDQLRAMAMEKSRELASQLRLLRKTDPTEELATVQGQMETYQTEYEELEQSIGTVTTAIGTREEELREYLSKKIPNVEVIDPDPIEASLEEIQRQHELCSSLVAQAKEDRVSLMESKQVEEEKLAHYSPEDIENQRLSLNSKRALWVVDNQQVASLETDMRTQLALVSKLKQHKYNPDCEFCMNNQFVKDAMDAKQKAVELKRALDALQVIITQRETDIAALLWVEDEYKKIIEIQQYCNVFADKIQKVDTTIQGVTATIHQYELQTQQLQNKLDMYELNQQLIDRNAELDVQINAVKAQLKIHQLDAESFATRKVTLDKALATLQHQKTGLLEHIALLEQTAVGHATYEHYKDVMSRDGLPYYLMSNILPDIQKYANNLLQGVVEFTLLFEMEDGDISVYIAYDDDRKWALELASGMEKFISGLVIRLALIAVSNIPKSPIFLQDEGFGALDSQHLQEIQRLFSILKNSFDWGIIISHLDGMRDTVDQYIEITKDEDEYSYVNL